MAFQFPIGDVRPAEDDAGKEAKKDAEKEAKFRVKVLIIERNLKYLRNNPFDNVFATSSSILKHRREPCQ